MAQVGRKYQGDPGPSSGLVEFHTRLQEAMRNAGYPTTNRLLQILSTHISKSRLYLICSGRELARIEEVNVLARALSVSPDILLEPWNRARIAVEREALIENAKVLASTATWVNLPKPAGEIRDLLEAQLQISELFPYQILGLKAPPASQVFIRPVLSQIRSPSAKSGGSSVTSHSVPVEDALNSYEHVVIIGDPGCGKSMLSRSIVRDLCEHWLRMNNSPITDEALVPIYTAAINFPSYTSWSSRVAAAVNTNEHLLSTPSVSLFASKVMGARWLLVVDGLDEILDVDRRREVLHALRTRINAVGPYRLLITSRNLPKEEMDFLRAKNVGEYLLQIFSHDQLRSFAVGWFKAQGDKEPSLEAKRFVTGVLESSLQDVVTTPLLATIAVATVSSSATRSLPLSPVDLYRQFIEVLLGVEKFQAVDQNTRALSWLYRNRRTLITFVARDHLDGGSNLLSTATRWARDNRPFELGVDSLTEADVERVLGTSGVVNVTSGIVQFIHQSIAEYLAAEYYAEALNHDVDGLEPWVKKAVDYGPPANLALLTLAIWSRSEGNDGGQVVRQLLKHGDRAFKSLITIIRLGAAIDYELGAEVANKLTQGLANTLSSVGEFPDLVKRAGKLPTLDVRLKSLIRSNYLTRSRRIEIAGVYGSIYSRREAIVMLKNLIDCDDLGSVTIGLYELDALGVDRSELAYRAREILNDPSSAYWTQLNAADALYSYGELEGLSESCLRLLAAVRVSSQEFVRAAILLLNLDGRTHGPLILSYIQQEDSILLLAVDELVEALEEAGCYQEIESLGQKFITDPHAESNDEMVSAVVRAWGRSSLQTGRQSNIITAIREADHLSGYTLSSLLKDLYRAGLVREVEDLVIELFGRLGLRHYGLEGAIDILIEVNASKNFAFVIANAPPTVLIRVGKLISHLLISLAGREQVIDMARSLLEDPAVSHDLQLLAAGAWLRVEGADLDALLAVIDGLPLGPAERAAFASVAVDHGALRMGRSLARSIISDRVAGKQEILQAIRICLRGASAEEERALLTILRSNGRCKGSELAWIADEIGSEVKAVLDLWVDVLVSSKTSMSLRVRAAEELRSSGSFESGISAIALAKLQPHTQIEADLLERLRMWML